MKGLSEWEFCDGKGWGKMLKGEMELVQQRGLFRVIRFKICLVDFQGLDKRGGK